MSLDFQREVNELEEELIGLKTSLREWYRIKQKPKYYGFLSFRIDNLVEHAKVREEQRQQLIDDKRERALAEARAAAAAEEEAEEKKRKEKEQERKQEQEQEQEKEQEPELKQVKDKGFFTRKYITEEDIGDYNNYSNAEEKGKEEEEEDKKDEKEDEKDEKEDDIAIKPEVFVTSPPEEEEISDNELTRINRTKNNAAARERRAVDSLKNRQNGSIDGIYSVLDARLTSLVLELARLNKLMKIIPNGKHLKAVVDLAQTKLTAGTERVRKLKEEDYPHMLQAATTNLQSIFEYELLPSIRLIRKTLDILLADFNTFISQINGLRRGGKVMETLINEKMEKILNAGLRIKNDMQVATDLYYKDFNKGLYEAFQAQEVETVEFGVAITAVKKEYTTRMKEKGASAMNDKKGLMTELQALISRMKQHGRNNKKHKEATLVIEKNHKKTKVDANNELQATAIAISKCRSHNNTLSIQIKKMIDSEWDVKLERQGNLLSSIKIEKDEGVELERKMKEEARLKHKQSKKDIIEGKKDIAAIRSLTYPLHTQLKSLMELYAESRFFLFAYIDRAETNEHRVTAIQSYIEKADTISISHISLFEEAKTANDGLDDVMISDVRSRQLLEKDNKLLDGLDHLVPERMGLMDDTMTEYIREVEWISGAAL